MNQIYIPHKDGKGYEVCYLLEKSRQYKDCIFEEIIFQQELNRELVEVESNQQAQLNIDLDKEIEDIVKGAKEAKGKTITETTSKAKKLNLSILSLPSATAKNICGINLPKNLSFRTCWIPTYATLESVPTAGSKKYTTGSERATAAFMVVAVCLKSSSTSRPFKSFLASISSFVNFVCIIPSTISLDIGA